MELVDAAHERFSEILASYNLRRSEIENEAQLRFEFLDRIFLEVLGWSREDIHVEPPSEHGYADYLFRIGDRAVAVVEAKRGSYLLVDTAKSTRSNYLIRGPVLRPAAAGIKQAREYASDHSASFAAVTSGSSWVCFQPSRGDGRPFGDGQAIVFPTLDAVAEGFSEFFDLFSKVGISEKRFMIHFSRMIGLSIVANIDWHIAVDDRRNPLIPRAALARDLDRVFDKFFKSLSDETDKQMLIDCFVETKESRDADVNLQKLAEEVLADISALSGSAGELQQEIADAVESHLGEIVLIIGNKGAGKSTFIDRFFSVVLPRLLREKCAVVRADLADATQYESDIEPWLTERLILQLEQRLFDNGIPTYEDLQGMYFSEYQRWMVGEYKFLYERDRVEFKIRFGESVRRQVEEDRRTYLVRLLKNANEQRLLLPCLIFDNTDQFPQSFQERVFQYAHSLYRSAIAFIIVPITDRTIWRLSKAGPFQSYATKSFYLPIPSTKDILERRVAYIKKRTADNRDGKTYFTDRGIRLSLSSLTAFAGTVEEVFVKRDFVSRRVSWLANLDVRRSLELAQRVITSPALKIEELVTAYVAGEVPRVTDNRITRALIVNNHKFYASEDNSFVQNVFSTRLDRLVSPLLKLSVLRLLLDRVGMSRDEQSAQYLELSAIIAYFEPAGVPAIDVLEVVREMLEARLAVI